MRRKSSYTSGRSFCNEASSPWLQASRMFVMSGCSEDDIPPSEDASCDVSILWPRVLAFNKNSAVDARIRYHFPPTKKSGDATASRGLQNWCKGRRVYANAKADPLTPGSGQEEKS